MRIHPDSVSPRLVWGAPILLSTALAACGGGGSASAAPPAASTASAGLSPSVPLPGYQLVWQDEFDGGALDSAKWNIHTEARNDATNSAASVSVQNGMLTITTFTQGGVNYTGFIDTANKYQPTYGFMEARIRFAPTAGEWGAFWLQSPTIGTPLGDPGSAGTEIDVVEHRAVNTGNQDVSREFSSTLHWDGYGANHQSVWSNLVPLPGGGAITGQWHTFAVLWTPASYTFYVDGQQTWTTSSAISNRSEFLRLTCEVRNAFWAGSIPAGGYGSLATSTTKMDVDWVRVWQRS